MTTRNNYDYANASIASLSIKAGKGDARAKLFLKAARLERSYELDIELSAEDADLYFTYTWYVNNSGYPCTSVDAPAEYATARGNKFITSLNRLVLSRMLGCEVWEIPTDIEADHIHLDRELTDCRRDNIQPLTADANKRRKKASRKAVA